MIIPANIIQESKYTSGGELVYKKSNAAYKGYYYALNNSFFVGKNFDQNADELVKLTKANTLMTGNTFNYAFISGITSQQLAPNNISSVQIDEENNPPSIRYFAKKLNVMPQIIKEIDEKTYNVVKNDEFYQTTFISDSQSLTIANQQMPGLQDFLLG